MSRMASQRVSHGAHCTSVAERGKVLKEKVIPKNVDFFVNANKNLALSLASHRSFSF